MARQIWYAPRDVADELGVDYQTVLRWIHYDEIPATKFGKQYRISRVALDKWIAARGVQPRRSRKKIVQEIA
jgi:excisionase family DNA binding protein